MVAFSFTSSYNPLCESLCLHIATLFTDSYIFLSPYMHLSPTWPYKSTHSYMYFHMANHLSLYSFLVYISFPPDSIFLFLYSYKSPHSHRYTSHLHNSLTIEYFAQFLGTTPLNSTSSYVDRSFCPAQSCSHSVPKKHKEAYVNYELVGLLAQASY